MTLNTNALPPRFTLDHLPVVLCAVSIFIQSSIPQQDIPKLDILSYDKVIHVAVYFVFGYWLCHALNHSSRYPFLSQNWMSYGLLFGLLFALSDETHQLFTPGRSAEVMDINADGLGLLLALSGYRVMPLPSLYQFLKRREGKAQQNTINVTNSSNDETP